MYLSALTDRELIQHAWVHRDPLTSTAMEERLLARFTTVLDEAEVGKPMLALLDEYDIENVEQLRNILERDARVTDLINHMAEPMAELAELAGQST